MKNKLIALLTMAAMTFVAYHVTLFYFPNYVYSVFYKRAIGQEPRLENKFSILLSPDEESRMVVKPNPDFAYGSVFYNLEDGPIRILGEMPDSTYWSSALYKTNTINYYVKNDLQYATDELNLVLSVDPMDDIFQELIIAPERSGFLLVRVLDTKKSTSSQSTIAAHLNSLRVEKFKL